MRILYIPIDERPCNTTVVERIAESGNGIDLVTVPKNLLGFKKTPANNEAIWEWLNKEANHVDAVILSIDMLIYGGLLPSRIHYIPMETASMWINRLRSFRQSYPNLPIYASNLIMRTPRYSSSDEEPDYYETWGREIFLQAYLEDKLTHDGITDEQAKELNNIKKRLPKQYVEDYEQRRAFNLNINQQVLELVKEGVINFLSIPQDDSAEYGYTAIDQKVITQMREKLQLYQRVHIYPGADEVGATLLARVYNNLRKERPKIYPIWSSTLGPEIIPMYEDRPFQESMKSHILAAGCQIADRAESADLILAYNTPGKVMQESWDQGKKDITYSNFRNLLFFVDQIKQYIERGKKVIVADSAYANGGDLELIRLLDEACILDQLVSYKGWNTNCNTLGTTIAQGVIGQHGRVDRIKENVMYHLLDDYFYQAEIRMDLTENFLPKYHLNYFDLKDKAEMVNNERNEKLSQRFKEEISNNFREIEIERLTTSAPWNRMFEIGLELITRKKYERGV